MSEPLLPPEGWKRLPCGCHAEWTGEQWQIAASLFLCGHKQGELVGRPRPDYDPHIDHPERFREGPI